MVETTGVEPVTSCMSSRHSNQLSYASITLFFTNKIIAQKRIRVNLFYNFFMVDTTVAKGYEYKAGILDAEWFQ